MRLSADHFLINTTSGQADRVFGLIDACLQQEWRYDCVIQNVTQAWATWALAGPRARDVLEALGTDLDLSPATFPHLHVRCGLAGGMGARVARVSFSGELGYEISVPSGAAEALGAAITRAGSPFGLVPYGIEALEILRIEKGYLHVGADTDSETQPADIGFGAAVGRKAADFVGRRSLMRPRSVASGRKQLVGLALDDPKMVLPMGAHLLNDERQSIGFVGSSAASPILQRGVALALLEDGRSMHGQKVGVYSMGDYWEAIVGAPCAYDNANERLNG
jgi:sarcosine oxidase subunit alpha